MTNARTVKRVYGRHRGVPRETNMPRNLAQCTCWDRRLAGLSITAMPCPLHHLETYSGFGAKHKREV